MSNDYYPQQIDRIIKETPKTIVGLIIISSILVFIFIDYVPTKFIIIWIFVQIIFISLRFLNAKKLQKYLILNNNIKLKQHINYLTLLIAASGIIWNIRPVAI